MLRLILGKSMRNQRKRRVPKLRKLQRMNLVSKMKRRRMMVTTVTLMRSRLQRDNGHRNGHLVHLQERQGLRHELCFLLVEALVEEGNLNLKAKAREDPTRTLLLLTLGLVYCIQMQLHLFDMHFRPYLL